MKGHAKNLFAAVVTAVAALITGAVPSLLYLLWRAAIGRHTQTAIISKEDPLYQSVIEWCGQLPSMQRVTRWRASSCYSGSSERATMSCGTVAGGCSPSPVNSIDATSTPFSMQDALEACPPSWGVVEHSDTPDGLMALRPGVTGHSFHYKGAWFRVQVCVSPGISLGSSTVDTLEIRTVARTPGLMRDLLAEVAVFAAEQKKKQARVCVSSVSDGWRSLFSQQMRPASSIVLDGTLMEDMLADARKFFTDWRWYRDMGIPWRRGYGLFGPPGGGKSSVIQAVCGELGIDLYVLRLSEDGMTDSTLERMMLSVPNGSAVAIEDADVAMVSQDRADEDEEGKEYDSSGGGIGMMLNHKSQTARYARSRVTLSGLLNALDGITASEGRLLFLTSNYPERLDAALMRPGRVDRRFTFGYASYRQAVRQFERFFPLAGLDQAVIFADALANRMVSMAELQEFLLERRDDPSLVLEDISRWAKDLPVASVAVAMIEGQL